MSTILNALRRLEEDASSGEAPSTDPGPASDPRATDELRSRILEEERAAAARAEQHNQSLFAQPLPRALGAAAALLVAISLGVFVVAPRFASTDSPTSPAAKPTALATALSPTPAMREATIGIQAATAPTASNVVATAPTSRPSLRTSLASAARSGSRRETIEGRHDRSPTPSRATQARPTPSLNLARTASVAAPPIPTRSSGTPTPIDALPIVDDSTAANSINHSIGPPSPVSSPVSSRVPTQSPTQSPTQLPTQPRTSSKIEAPVQSAAGRSPETNLERTAEPPVQQHIAPPTPDIAVLQTAWHPTPDHRSAKIRLLESNETLTLSEGDAVGPLVVQKITPSTVVFLSGDIELRLRVGQPGSGR